MPKIIECIPNFSDGRNPAIIQALIPAVRSVRGVWLLSHTSDPDHHRSVLTFAGRPDALCEAAFQAIRIATERIDLRRHEGVHPRIGATDVVPFVPLQDATMEDCVQLARRLGERVRLNPPTPDLPQWTCLGDQTEAALRVLALKGGLDEADINREYPRIHELPFDAKRKRMSTIHSWVGQEIAFVKGAPREVLQLCSHIVIHGEVCELTQARRTEILAANDDYARNALRVLAIAWRELPPRAGPAKYLPETVERDLTFLGLAAMMDPPRPEVADAIKKFHEAGIRLAMITGDYGLTAESVSRRIGLLNTPVPLILTGAELDALTDEDLQRILGEEIIFARMAPDHKLRIVAALQARGETVAVIGDGVNDAPALRKSDIGIAMGITGTDVAKQAADVILTDDKFNAIVSQTTIRLAPVRANWARVWSNSARASLYEVLVE